MPFTPSDSSDASVSPRGQRGLRATAAGESAPWELSQPAFERFLTCLHPDRAIAAARHEEIRLKLLRFFEWRGCTLPEEHVDETITRVIRKLDEGDDIKDAASYCFGVARLVLLEALKRQKREKEALARFMPVSPISEDAELEQRLECLRSCMRTLPAEQRMLVTEYHRHDGQARIEGRKQLAVKLGIGLNALRIRAHRLSERLVGCVRQCLGRGGGEMNLRFGSPENETPAVLPDGHRPPAHDPARARRRSSR